MRASSLRVGQKFKPPGAQDVFTLAQPMELVGGVLMLKVEERPGDTMSLMPNDEVTLVD